MTIEEAKAIRACNGRGYSTVEFIKALQLTEPNPPKDCNRESKEMITEDYVSFETAKLLKEEGFDAHLHVYYSSNGLVQWMTGKKWMQNKDLTSTACIRPTIQMAMKWLEEKYGVFCVIRRHGDNKDGSFTYSWNCEGKMGLSIGNDGGFKTVAEACEAAIKYCLENLI